jgi:hypothetical protein
MRWPAAATAVAAVALAVTGCAQTQLGAAALYSSQQHAAGAFTNQRISAARLTAEVSNLNAGYQRYKRKGVQIPYAQAVMPQKVLTWMLTFATADQVAVRLHLHVTPAQAQAQLGSEILRARQSGDTLVEVAVLNGLPPDMAGSDDLGRWLAIQQKLAARLANGVAPTTAAQQQALALKLNHTQCLAAKSMTISVNPQYGAFDYRSLTVVPKSNSLSAGQVASKVQVSPSPELTPQC